MLREEGIGNGNEFLLGRHLPACGGVSLGRTVVSPGCLKACVSEGSLTSFPGSSCWKQVHQMLPYLLPLESLLQASAGEGSWVARPSLMEHLRAVLQGVPVTHLFIPCLQPVNRSPSVNIHKDWVAGLPRWPRSQMFKCLMGSDVTLACFLHAHFRYFIHFNEGQNRVNERQGILY